MSNSKLIDKVIPAYSGNYTKGRSEKISKITIHHMAMVASIEDCGRVFQKVGREGSSHYGIGKDGRIGLYVDEKNTAWTDSNWDSNCRSVTIENSNSQTGGNWPVSDATLTSLIKLVADIAKRNNLGKLIVGKNLTWHRLYSNTICPGDYLISKMQYIADEANKINAGEEIKEDITYVVKRGDTLSGIAQKYNTTWQELAKYNAITNPNFIFKGQVIKIPIQANEWVDGTYKIIISKTLRTSMSLTPTNRVRVKQVDAGTKKHLTSTRPNDIAMFKRGALVYLSNAKMVGNLRYMKYGNVYIVVQNADGSKQVEKV